MALQKIVIVNEDGGKKIFELIPQGDFDRRHVVMQHSSEREKAMRPGALNSTARTMRLMSCFFLFVMISLTAGGLCHAVMPPSTVLNEEIKPSHSEQRFTEIMEKLKQREEDDIRFLEGIKSELKELDL